MKWTVLESVEDRSVNFILPMEQGNIEARYVRRGDEYFIVYLSSHTGCKHACRMCHLTSTGQTYFEPVDCDLYLEQALRVLSHYDAVQNEQGVAKMVHYNWMARGEALSNPHLIKDGHAITSCLRCMASERGLVAKFNISTIIPKDFKHTLVSAFHGMPLDFYYSVYTMDEKFRKRWLPNAIPALRAFEMLSEWQQQEKREVVLHWAFIAGENDSEADVNGICDAVDQIGLKARVNVVRYNPPNDKSIESSEEVIARNFSIIQGRMAKSKIVPRVGRDIFASCGTFVGETV